MIEFRDEPKISDIENIGKILAESAFFTKEEQEIGISLIKERLERGIESEYYFQIGEIDHAVVSYTCFGPIGGTQSSFDLYWIAVEPNKRGRGLGSLVLQRTESIIQKMGGTRIYVETSSTPIYEPTRAFYSQNGYRLEATLEDYYAVGDHKLLYVKAIT